MRKEKYIQLPPIPEELDGNVVRMIWEYTKLPEKERQFVYEQYKVLSDNSNSESDVNAVLIKPDHPEKIEEFGNNMKAVIAELFREAVGLAQYVYEECFVNGKDVEEILSDDPRKTEAILATYMLFLNNGNGDVGMPS
ncbi:MAG: hypothetical protein SO471_11280 [Anaerobutyricum hallii]|uniref:hypothetical protein n=1 Tax=Anaerobutyricum hallii TaxID=39488 RepID=UPI002A810694|nr:hypothetical protein [Anaerobutyricum hallii]MDY4578511.1 hypothetical protein [Anaerobutyricum hallii]